MTTESFPRRTIIASLFAAALGLIDTAILTAQHYRIANEGLMAKSFCTLSNVIDCDTALTSAYSHLGPIPNSELGFLFYMVIFVLGAWILSVQKHRKACLGFLVIWALGGTLYSLYMAYILIGVLKILCLFCTASHLLVLFILISLLIGTRGQKREIYQSVKDQGRGWFMAIVTVLLVYGIGLLFFYGLNKRAHTSGPEFNSDTLVRYFYSQEPLKTKIPQDRPFWGSPDAPITIVVFSDFQCPYCRLAAFSLKPFLGEFKKDVKIIYLQFPLDPTCNPDIPQSAHTLSCLAAKASLCVYRDKGNEGFWPYHDLVFENQEALSHQRIMGEFSDAVGMSQSELRNCVTDPAIDQMVAEDLRLGKTFNLQGTPAIYINGRYLNGWAEPKILRTIIRAELKRLGH